MVIDSHQHFWKYDATKHSWIDDSMKVIRKDFLPKDLKSILKTNNVDGCIAVQADQTEEETLFLLKSAEENPFIKGVVGWVDLRAKNIEERLQHFSQNKLFKGVRHIVQAEADDYFMLREDFMNGISKLEKLHLTYDILVFPKQLPAAIQLVEKFPNQRFVLDHIAKPEISKTIDSLWVKNIKELAKHKNVSCKLSGLVTETTDFKWNIGDFTPFLDVVTNAFGVDRILFGSDWPVCLLAGEYKAVLQIIEHYFADVSAEVTSKIMGLNAVKFYNL